MVTMLLCPAELEAEAYAAAGQDACGSRMPCGAWIWIDEAAIPAEAPGSHDELPRSSVQSAVAVWVNEKSELILLERNEAE